MSITNVISVDFDSKTQRLVMRGGFHLLDIFRSFPSRRFDPKTKAWKMPIVKQNVLHLREMEGKLDLDMTPAAEQAFADFDKLLAGPAHAPIPRVMFDLDNYQPMDHQWPMLDKGWGLKGYALFAAMGTGKTFVTINIATKRWRLNQIDRLVIICPQTLRHTWRREFKKYADQDEVDIFDHANTSAYAKWANEPDKRLKVLLVSVEGLGISDRLAYSVLGFTSASKHVMAVCDESSRIKNPSAKRAERAIVIAQQCEYRMILNGTPIAKGIHDLWAQYEFIDPNIIGSGDYWAFKTRYVVMGGYENKQIIGYSKVDELMTMLQPYTLEVNKSILNLPPKIYKQIDIEPTREQQLLFDKILTGVGEGPMIQVQNVLERMLRLQQVIGGFEPRTDPETLETTTHPLAKNPKMDALMEVIDGNYTGSKFIVWARYIPELEVIVRSLRQKYGDSAVVGYYGATSPEDRKIAEDRYCNDPTCRVLVGNPAAAGLGLTLISGENDVMVYYSGTFAYIDRAQSEDRSHRIGQANSVVIADFVMRDTLDVSIQAAIREKKDMDEFVKEYLNRGASVADLVSGRGL